MSTRQVWWWTGGRWPVSQQSGASMVPLMAMHGVVARWSALAGRMINGVAEQIRCGHGWLQFAGSLLVVQSKWSGFVCIHTVSWVIYFSLSIYYLYIFIRRPRLILDFALTLVFNHIVLTIYYSASIPTSSFFWLIMLGGATLTIIAAEQLCIRREMKEGLGVAPVQDGEDRDDIELGSLLPRQD